MNKSKVISEATDRKQGLKVIYGDVGIVLTLFDLKGERDSVYIEIDEWKQINKIVN